MWLHIKNFLNNKEEIMANTGRTKLLDICAALAYMPCGDWRKAVYWSAAAALTYVVTW